MPVIRRVILGAINGFLIGAAVGVAFVLLLFSTGGYSSTEFWHGIGVAIACCVAIGTVAGMSLALASAGAMSPLSSAGVVMCGALLGVLMVMNYDWTPYKGFPALLAPVLGMLAAGVLAFVTGKFRRQDAPNTPHETGTAEKGEATNGRHLH